MSNTSDDARQTADKVLRRERRRIRALGVAAIGLWVLAALLIASVYLPIGAKLKQFAKMLEADAPAGFRFDPQRINTSPVPAEPTPDQLPKIVSDLRHKQWIMGEVIMHEWLVGAFILTLALATGMIASVATVMLALLIRRGTLRQVSEQLATISDQLRQLQRGTAA